MNYSRKSIYKLAVFFVILLLFLLSYFLINNFLQAFKSNIELSLSGYFKRQVVIEKINYLPPNFIVLKNISTLKQKSPINKLLFSAEKIKLAFSLKTLLKDRSFLVSGIYLYQPRIDFVEILDFSKCLLSMRNIFKQAVDSLCSLAFKQNMKITVADGFLTLARPDNFSSNIFIKVLEISPKGNITTKGLINLYPENDPEAFGYSLNGSFNKNSFLMENLEFKNTNFYAKFWGSLEGDILRCKGFSYLSNFFRESSAAKEGLLQKMRKIKNLLPKIQITPVSNVGDLNIMDLDCSIKLSDEGIEVDNLSFLLNNAPVSLKGGIKSAEQILLDIKLSYFPGQSLSVRLKNRGFDAQATGALSYGQFSGKVGLSFLSKKGAEVSDQKIEVDFKNLSPALANKKHLRVAFDEANFIYISGNDLYKLEFKNFKSLFITDDKKIKFGFSSSIYDGSLGGYGLGDISQFPFKNFLSIKARGLNARELNVSLARYCNLYGKLDSDIHLYNLPELNLIGKVKINNGYIENLNILRWLSDFFALEELKKVNFNNLSGRFLINGQAVGLEQVSLNSGSFNLGGYFRLNKNNLVSGKVFLSLSQELLKRSKKFKPLLDLLSKEVRFVNFDFQLSGLFDSMNFKWLESEFKNKLRSSLPGFIKRGVERQLEDAINSILSPE